MGSVTSELINQPRTDRQPTDFFEVLKYGVSPTNMGILIDFRGRWKWVGCSTDI